MTRMLTASARIVDLAAPDVGTIDIHDIAHHLAHICRFNGAAGAYTVAQHSVLVSMLVPPADRMAALLHDAHEAYCGDMTSPYKQYLEARFPGFHKVEDMLQAQVLARFGITSLPDSVHQADLVMLATERRDLLRAHPVAWPCLQGIEPDRRRVTPWNHEAARLKFLSAFYEYGGAE